jgi:p-aminobenzoyl-glutamate transporter AbgT
MRWLPFIILMSIITVGCATTAVDAQHPTDNKDIAVDRLFSHDGCSVYRFYGVRLRQNVKSVNGLWSR